MVSGRLVWKFLLLFLISAFLIKPVFASTTDGTISSGYAWSSRIGWINFGATNGNVHVTDDGLTGSAWSELYGWIKLNPGSSRVINNGEGDLSGSAWGANIGWVDFSGVSIGSDGIFYGTASGTNTGVINFSCTNCLVQTDWRPSSVRSITPSAVAVPVTVAGVSGSAVPATSSSANAASTSPSTDTFPTTTTFSPNAPPSISKVSSGEQEGSLDRVPVSAVKENEAVTVKEEKKISPIQKLESYFTSSSVVKNILLENRGFRLIFIIIISAVVLLLRYFYRNRKSKL